MRSNSLLLLGLPAFSFLAPWRSGNETQLVDRANRTHSTHGVNHHLDHLDFNSLVHAPRSSVPSPTRVSPRCPPKLLVLISFPPFPDFPSLPPSQPTHPARNHSPTHPSLPFPSPTAIFPVVLSRSICFFSLIFAGRNHRNEMEPDASVCNVAICLTHNTLYHLSLALSCCRHASEHLSTLLLQKNHGRDKYTNNVEYTQSKKKVCPRP